MVNSEFVQIPNNIKMVEPFKRKSYVAMLLSFYPGYYTNDYDDADIMYGQRKYDNLNRQLKYIRSKRLLIQKGFTDISLLSELFKKNDMASVNKIFNQYKIDKSIISKNEQWEYFRSYSLEGNNISHFHKEDIKHRLYLTIGLEQRGNFVNNFITNCVNNNIPYYFKVFPHKGQTDTVVIYINSDYNLEKTINVINAMYLNANMQKVKDSTKKPAPHLFKINEYIGYGFEPNINGLSYTQFIQECEYSVSDKCNSLRKRILNDFNNGNIYLINNIKSPTKEEVIKFCQFNKNEQYLFFINYFKYILSVYGSYITEILDEIKQNMQLTINQKSIKI